jgi:hypothetical protein
MSVAGCSTVLVTMRRRPGGSGAGEAEDRVIAGLRAAAGENNLVGIGTDQRRDPRARLLDGIPGAVAQRRCRRRIAELAPQERQHRLQHIRRDGRRTVVIEIDRRGCRWRRQGSLPVCANSADVFRACRAHPGYGWPMIGVSRGRSPLAAASSTLMSVGLAA